MANALQKNQRYPTLGYRIDGKGIAYDLKSGQPLSRQEVDGRLAQARAGGAQIDERERKRGGVAGFYDRNKKVIVPAAEFLAPFLPGVGPLVSAGIGAATGFDRPGKGGIGYDPMKGVLGAAQGYALGKVGDTMQGAMSGADGIGSKIKAAAKTVIPKMAGGGNGLPNGLPNMMPAGDGNGGGGGMPDWLKTLLVGGQGINAAQLMGKSLDYAKNAEGTAMSNWNANAPLREAGRAGMLNPKSSVDTSALPGIRSANPFARGAK